MGMAMQLYVQDWQRVFPYSTNPAQSWTQLLMTGGSTGYGGVAKMRICPEALTPIANPPSPSFGTAHLQWTNSPETGPGISASYGINGWLYDTTGTDFPTLQSMANARGTVVIGDVFYRATQARGESQTPVMVDSNWRQIFAKPTDPVPASLENNGPADLVDHPLGRACMDRHKLAVNVSFLDGHAETVGLGKLWGLNWSKNWITQSFPVFH